jgi:hypothetical protein
MAGSITVRAATRGGRAVRGYIRKAPGLGAKVFYARKYGAPAKEASWLYSSNFRKRAGGLQTSVGRVGGNSYRLVTMQRTPGVRPFAYVGRTGAETGIRYPTASSQARIQRLAMAIRRGPRTVA